MKIRVWIAAIAACLSWAAGPAAAEYAMHGRVSHDSGNTLVRGADGGDWAHATTNTLLLPGDTLLVEDGGLSEFELPQGTFVRLADGSKVELISIDPSIAMRGWQGSFYVQRLNRSPGEALFETPAGTLAIEPDTHVRVDVTREGNATVSVRWGRVTVRTPSGGSVVVLSGRRSFIDVGLLPATPILFDRSLEDDFDSWSRERAEYLVRGHNNTPQSVSVTPTTLGVSDLHNYGEWVYVDNRQYWRPTVVTNYVPYRTGYWNYVPRYGHVWVGSHPFCYTTSHYGRWNYNARYGWLWSYHRDWSPAWVVGVRYGDYYAWTPCDYNYRPVLSHHHGHFSIGGVNFSVHATSYVPYNYLYRGPYHVHAYHNDLFAPYHRGGYQNNNVTINIWNPYGNNDFGRRYTQNNPFRGNSTFTVRDYNPQRSIRGAQQLTADSRTAAARATRMQQSINTTTFTRANVQRGTQTRTGYRQGERSADVRTVRASRGNGDAFQRGANRSTVPTITNRTVRDSNATLPTVSRTSSGNRSVRIDPGNARGTRTSTGTTSTGRNVTIEPSTSPRTQVVRSGNTSSGRTVTRTESRAPRSIALSPQSTRGSTRSDSTLSQRSTTPRVTSTTPSTRSTTQNTSRGGTVTRVQPRSNTRTTTPSVTRVQPRSSTPSITRVEPRSNTRTSTPSVTRVQPRSTSRSTTPSVTRVQPRSSTPSVTRSQPRSTSRSTTIQRSAPTRVQPRSTSRSTTSIQRSAPVSRSTSPSISRGSTGSSRSSGGAAASRVQRSGR